MNLSQNGIELLKAHEGYSSKAYLCPAGVWTIGYGHTGQVKDGDRCTREQAEEWLRQDVHVAEEDVNSLVRAKLSQNQFDALVSFVYNVGHGSFASSTLLRLLNEGRYDLAAAQFPRWVYAGGKQLNGLVARRTDERELFQGSVH